MSSDSKEIKESPVEESTTKSEEPKRRGKRRREEETMEVAKEKTTTAVVPTIPKRLLNRIDRHDSYLTTIQRDVRLLNRELKKLTTRVNRIEARLVSLRAKTKKGVGSSKKKKKGRTK